MAGCRAKCHRCIITDRPRVKVKMEIAGMLNRLNTVKASILTRGFGSWVVTVRRLGAMRGLVLDAAAVLPFVVVMVQAQRFCVCSLLRRVSCVKNRTIDLPRGWREQFARALIGFLLLCQRHRIVIAATASHFSSDATKPLDHDQECTTRLLYCVAPSP